MEYFGNRSGDGHIAVLVSDVQDPLGGYTSARVSDLQLYSNLRHQFFCLYRCVIYIFCHEINFYQHTAAEDVSRSVAVSPVS
jgi:hypothetical protein